MFSISSKQHSKILGFALLGYSRSLLVASLKDFYNLRSDTLEISSNIERFGFGATLIDLYASFDRLIYFLVILISAVSILKFNSKLKYLALIFIPFAIDIFPLGTILCLYVLLYIFVISENKIEVINTGQEKQNEQSF